MNYPLTIVSAPMGYGKTTAVREYLRKSRIKHIWMPLNDASANCGYFWNRLTQRISEDYHELGTELQGLGFPNSSIHTDRMLDTLWSISPYEDFILVLDDYHLAENNYINQLLETIAKNRIPNFHLVIVSRHLPNINLTELMVKNLLLQIDTAFFRFSDQDVLRYFNLMGFPLAQENVSHIQHIAGGWVSALYLIYRGIKGGIPLQYITTVQELIQSAVYEPYDEKTKTTLCALAILGTFTLELAAYATRITEIKTIIKTLHRENAFIDLDKKTGVYTIHHVFNDYLTEEAGHRGIETKEICRRAGEWYLMMRDNIQAYRYLFRGEAYNMLLQELEKPAYISVHDRPMFFKYFDAIPQEYKNRHPISYLKFILLFVMSGNRQKGNELLNQFEEDMAKEELWLQRSKEIEATVHLIKMFQFFNDEVKMIYHMESALELLDGNVSVICSYQSPFSLGSPHFTYIYYKEAGAYKTTMELPLEKYAELSGGSGLGSAALCLAEYAFEIGDFELVESNAFKSIYQARTKYQTSIEICASLTLVRLYLFKSRYIEALALLNNLADKVASNIEPILLNTYDLCLGYFYACSREYEKIPRWIIEGDISVSSEYEEIPRWISKADMSANSILLQGAVFSYVVYGKTLILAEEWLRAEVLCETFIPYFKIYHNQLGHIHNYLHLAIASYQQGHQKKAKEWLLLGLQIGQADNIVMPFAENGANLFPLLSLFNDKDCIDRGYINQIIDLCIQYSAAIQGILIPENPLSPRESEVLRLMARGLSREEIAIEMYLSSSTVRTHIQNIYHKLDVSKKSAALQKATEMNILS